MKEILLVILTTIAPISELRGGLPLAISLGYNPYLAYLLIVLLNISLYLPVTFMLNLFHRNYFSRWNLYQRYIKKLQSRGKPYIDRFGVLGLALFVAVPLPASGVYSGTVLSWLLGMNWYKGLLAITLGALVAGLIVLIITMGVTKI